VRTILSNSGVTFPGNHPITAKVQVDAWTDGVYARAVPQGLPPRHDSAGGAATERHHYHDSDSLHLYDPLGRLTSANYSTSESFAYACDDVGNRTAQTAPSSTFRSFRYESCYILHKVLDRF
jgi:YD repeat-containing protein